MATPAPADFAREKRLIEQLEFRIASADTSEKLQTILQKFLPALILKLASEDVGNRNLTIKVCQYINSRLTVDGSIQLPVEGLSKAFRDSPSPFVKQFSLLFLRQGLARLPPRDGIDALPGVLRSSIQATGEGQTGEKVFAVAIDFLLATLRHWTPPEHGSPDDEALKASFDLDLAQSTTIARQLSQFLLYDPKSTPTNLISDDLRQVYEKHSSLRGKIVPNIAGFVFTSLFDDTQRFIPATILSTDANAAANSKADIMFKQCTFDLESDTLLDAAFDLYSVAKPKLQTRILTLLARSKTSTTRTDKIIQIIESQLRSSTTNLETSKLRAAMFSYLIWAIRVSPTIHSIAKQLQESLKEFIEAQGWPTPHDLTTADADLRAKAYESIGLLAASRSQAPNPSNHEAESSSFDLVSWLFTSLRCDTSRDVRHSIEESLSRLMTSVSFSTSDTDEAQRYKDLLMWNIATTEGDEDPIYYMPTRTSAQYPAVRFANKIFPFADVDARVMDLLALASDRREVVEEGQRGLDPSWHRANMRLGASKPDEISMSPSLPAFAQFTSRLFDSSRQRSDKEIALLESVTVLSNIATFSRNLLAAQAWQGSSFAIDVDTDWQGKVEAALDNEIEARSLFKKAMNVEAPQSVSRLLQLCYEGTTKFSTNCGIVGFQLTSLASDGLLQHLDSSVIAKLENASMSLQNRNTVCRTIGILISSTTEWKTYVAKALSACDGWQTAVGQDMIVVETSLLKAAHVLSRAGLRGLVQGSDELVQTIWSLCVQILQKNTGKSLRENVYRSLGQLSLCLPSSKEAPKDLEVVIDNMLTDAKKESEVATAALGRLISQTWQNVESDKRTSLLEKLYDLHEVRKAEFQFALGEAFAVSALRFSSSSTVTEFDVDVEVPKSDAQPELFETLLNDILEKCQTTKPALKKAAGIWLLSLIQFCTISDLLKSRLRECQAAFSRLLGDRDEIVQETGSRGLSLVYEKGDKNLRDDLVRDLVQSFTGNSAKTSGTVTEETQLFEPGALPTENGQSVTTYKDIVSLAQEMGDPSLVYRFMNLASNNAIWTSRAAFGRFGLSGMLADSKYLQENKKFYPKLFRYRFDPNPNVQRSMEDIWKALVKDPNAVIDENFDLIMEDLLKSVISGREWRAREASCAAISDLVQGRETEKFEKYLDEIWAVAFKVLDDVKETVRLAAMKLCRTLTNMLIRNLEVGEGTTKRAKTMLKHAMPFLLKQMETGAAKEVQQYAIITLLDIVKKAPPTSLRDDAPVILETLVNSLSSLEHESINYLHLNADKYGLTAEKLDSMRVSSIGASPVSEAIEKCLDSLTTSAASNQDPDAMDGVVDGKDPLSDAMRRLEVSFKTTIGLPSRVGLSRVLIMLVVRHSAVFRPYADRFVRLTRKNLLDRNATISQSFSTALAYLLRLASEKEIQHTVVHAQKLYFEFQELSQRAVAGEIVQAVSKASNDVFNNFASLFLPFAFIGRKDLDEDVRDRFENAWKENVGGTRALHLYLKEILDLTSTHIKSSLWPIRHACCFAAAELTTALETGQGYSKDEAMRLWPLVQESVSGKTWDGKEKVIVAFPKFVKRATSIWPDASKQMQKIAIREARRNNMAYRPHAVAALAEFAQVRTDLDMGDEVIPFLVEAVEALVEGADEMDLDEKGSRNGRKSSESLVEETWCSIITCLFAVLRNSSSAENLGQAIQIVRKADAQASERIGIAIHEGAQRFIEDVVGKEPGESADETKSEILEDSARPLTPRTNPEASSKPKFERFFHELVLALYCADQEASSSPGIHASDTETLRLARIRMVSKLSTTGAISSTTRETLVESLNRWLQHERSQPIRDLLVQVIRANQKVADNSV